MIAAPPSSAAEVVEFDVAPDFEALCPPQTQDETDRLEIELKDFGCRDALVLWKAPDGRLTLIDGHTRRRLCNGLGIGFLTVTVELPDRQAAINWIIDNQLARRNLSDEQKSYLRGKRYLAEKKQEGAPKGSRNRAANNKRADYQPVKRTAEKLAEAYNVCPDTIKRDAEFAKGLDQVAKSEGEEARREILSGKSKRTKRDIARAAKPTAPAKRREPRDRFARDNFLLINAALSKALPDDRWCLVKLAIDAIELALELKRLPAFARRHIDESTKRVLRDRKQLGLAAAKGAK